MAWGLADTATASELRLLDTLLRLFMLPLTSGIDPLSTLKYPQGRVVSAGL